MYSIIVSLLKERKRTEERKNVEWRRFVRLETRVSITKPKSDSDNIDWIGDRRSVSCEWDQEKNWDKIMVVSSQVLKEKTSNVILRI